MLTNITVSNTYYKSSTNTTYLRGYFTVTGNVSDLSGAKTIKINGFNVVISGNTFSANVTNQSGTIYVNVYAEYNVWNVTQFSAGGSYVVDNTPPPTPYLLGYIPSYTPNQPISFCFYALGYLVDFSNDNFNWGYIEVNVNGYPLYYDWLVIDLRLNWIVDDIYRLDICFKDIVIPDYIVIPGQNNLEVCTLDRVGNASCNSATGDWYVRPTIDWISQNYGRQTQIVDVNVLWGTEITISGWGYAGFDVNTPAYDYITIGGVPVGPGYIKNVKPPTQYQDGSITFYVPEYVYSGPIRVFINGVGSAGLPFTVSTNRNKFVIGRINDGSGISIAEAPDGKQWISYKDYRGVYLIWPSSSSSSGNWVGLPIYYTGLNEIIGLNTSIGINNNGKTIVCYTTGQKTANENLIDVVGELKCFHNLAGNFRTDIVDWDVRLLNVAVAFDPITNLPGVVYSWGPADLYQPKELWYAWMDGNYVWHQVRVGNYSGYAFDLFLDIDSSMKPHIAFRFVVDYGYAITDYIGYATLKPDVYFPYVNTDSWAFEWLPLNWKDGFRPTIKVGSDGIPRIVAHVGDYYESTLPFLNKIFYGINNGVIKYAYKSGDAWYFEDVDYPGIYSRECPRPSNWNDEDVDKYLASEVIGVPVSFYLDAGNNPVISYYREDTKSLYLATRNPATGAWDNKMIDTGLDTDSVAIDVSRSMKARVAYNNDYGVTGCQDEIIEKSELLYFQEENCESLTDPPPIYYDPQWVGICSVSQYKRMEIGEDTFMNYLRNIAGGFDFSLLGLTDFDMNRIFVSALLNNQIEMNNHLIEIRNLSPRPDVSAYPQDYGACSNIAVLGLNCIDTSVTPPKFICNTPEKPTPWYLLIDKITIDRAEGYFKTAPFGGIEYVPPSKKITLTMKDGRRITFDLNKDYNTPPPGSAPNFFIEDNKKEDNTDNDCQLQDIITQIINFISSSYPQYLSWQSLYNSLNASIECMTPLSRFPMDVGTLWGIFPLTVNSYRMLLGCEQANCNNGFEAEFTKLEDKQGVLKVRVKIPLFQSDGWADTWIGKA